MLVVRFFEVNQNASFTSSSAEIDITQQINVLTNSVHETSERIIENLNAGDVDLFEIDRIATNSSGISWYVYSDAELIYWSDNSIPGVQDIKVFSGANEPGLIRIFNGWYLPHEYTNGSDKVIALIEIYREYSIRNKYLKNHFNQNIIPYGGLEFSVTENSDAIPVVNSGDQLFFVSEKTTFNTNDNRDISFFYLVLLTLSILSCFMIFRSKDQPLFIGFAIAGSYTFGILALIKLAEEPHGLVHSELFSPSLYASSSLLSSLGDLFLFATGIVFILQAVLTSLLRTQGYEKKTSKGIFSIICLVLVFVLAIYIFDLLSGLVLNSKLSFNINDIYSLSIFSAIGLSIVGILLFGILKSFEFLLIISVRNDHYGVKNYLLLFVKGIVTTSMLFVIIKVVFNIDVDTAIFLIAISSYALYLAFHYLKEDGVTFYNTLLRAAIYSIISVLLLTHFNNIKEKESRVLLASQLTNDQDLVIEYLIGDALIEISEDTVLLNIFDQPYDSLIQIYIDEDIVSKQLGHYFLSNYWSKYDIAIRSFYETDLPLNYVGDPTWSTYYFENMMQDASARDVSDNLVYLEADKSGIRYVGKVEIGKKGDERSGIVYFSFKEKTSKKNTGFPELLLSESLSSLKINEGDYSIATYEKGHLVSRSGVYPYKGDINRTFNLDGGFGESLFIRHGGFSHLLHTSQEKVIVISKSGSTFFTSVTLFAYLFTFYGLLIFVFYLFVSIIEKRPSIEYNYKTKIQVTLISAVIVTFIIIGMSSVILIRENYEQNTIEQADEKLSLISTKVSEEVKNRSIDSLQITDDLIFRYSSLSTMVDNDFILYSEDGEMVYSSQPKIYEQGLIGRLINSRAYIGMREEGNVSFRQYEDIGALKYLSVYEPILNEDYNIIGYINLPFFAKEEELNKEISLFLVTLINIYVLLLAVALLIAIIISNRITKPLAFIEQMMSKVQYGSINEPINWESDDEIGALVNQYNSMVSKLEKSAKKLARSEREGAWREMAKQVAHEIKNPLTPMKLNIQHLQKTWKEGGADIDIMMEKLTNTLTEQIDVLANIATEFASFAKMRQAKNQVVDVHGIISTNKVLYERDGNCQIILDANDSETFNVYADKEQLSRVFSNLLKNAIQSFKSDIPGEILIEVKKENANIHIAIIDNGSGIPLDIQHKIFAPNFTTKSGGTGLGLAIVKNIIVSSGGTIWFKSNQDQGTTFHILIPSIE